MEKVFDAHIHHLFDIPMEETLQIFKDEFAVTETNGGVFMSCPTHSHDGKTLEINNMQNIKMLFLKHSIPNSYAYAGLMLRLDLSEEEQAEEYLRQAKEYHAAGYDGMKMLEGYPSIRKVMQYSLCSPVYDKYYKYLEDNNIPITIHIANPEVFWDMSKVSEWVKKAGRACDETYPTKRQITDEIFGVMKKFPKLRMTLAHFGFLTYDISEARSWMDNFPNTRFDITPGGEQLLNIGKAWNEWHQFFIDYQDRIIYGSDYYAFPRNEEWEICFNRRPKFIRQFFETDTEHKYIEDSFKGILLEEDIRTKIYSTNALRDLGAPKKIDYAYMKAEAERLLAEPVKCSENDEGDLLYILTNI